MRAILLAALLLFTAGCGQPTSSPHLVAFTATWCEPCQRDKPRLSQLIAAGHTVTVVDADQSPDQVERYQVVNLPTYFVYDDEGLASQTTDIEVAIKAMYRSH